MRFRLHISFTCLLCITPLAASALIMTGRGNDPVQDAGWPQGALAVANLKSRVGWWEGPPFGGGEWQFLYRGDTPVFQEALAAFASIRAPKLALVVHDGPEENIFLKDPQKPEGENRIDWTFTVWNPERWHSLFNNPRSVFDADHPNFRQPVDPPRLDVYIGGGKVDWAQVKVPAGLQVRDERAAAAGVKVEGGAMLRAEVFDMATGKPIPGARVLVARRAGAGQQPPGDFEKVVEGATDAAGRAQVEKIPAGDYRVSVLAEGLAPATSVVADGYAPRVIGYERFREGAVKSFTVELARTESVHGQVLDSAGRPVRGVKIRASSVMGLDGRGYNTPAAPEATTGDNGHFTVCGLPRGFTQLWASAAGYHYADLFSIYDVPTTNLTLRVAPAGVMHIQVTDKKGNPLGTFDGVGVMVEVEPKSGARPGQWGASGNVKKEDGTIEFTEVPAGEYRVTSRPNPGSTDRKYAPEQIIKVEPGGRAEVKIAYE